MSDVKILDMPDEISLLDFFEVEPIGNKTSDGYFCYEVTDNQGCTLIVSFDIFERSLQTSLSFNGNEIMSVSHEGATKLEIKSYSENKVLRGEFVSSAYRTVLEIFIKPRIHVRWGTLYDPTRPPLEES